MKETISKKIDQSSDELVELLKHTDNDTVRKALLKGYFRYIYYETMHEAKNVNSTTSIR